MNTSRVGIVIVPRRREIPPVAYLLLLVTSLLVKAGGASADDVTDDDDTPMTMGCCWPLQFQAHLGRWSGTDAGGTPKIFEEETLLYFDYAFKRWGFWIREKYVTHDYMEIIYVEDYREGKATVAGIQGCARFPLPAGARMRLPCLPDNARYVETLWVGNRVLPYDVWEWTDSEFVSGDDVVTAKFSVSLSHDNCKPISDIAWWTAQNWNYTSYLSNLDLHLGETDGKTNDPFADIERFYTCTEYDAMPTDLDIRWDVFADQIYLLNRVHATSSTPPDLPPNMRH